VRRSTAIPAAAEFRSRKSLSTSGPWVNIQTFRIVAGNGTQIRLWSTFGKRPRRKIFPWGSQSSYAVGRSEDGVENVKGLLCGGWGGHGTVISFVLVRHFWPACEAALLFFLGAILAWPVARLGPGIFTRFPRMLLRWVARWFGTDPGIVRMTGVIFGFNGSAMFLYMASGVRPWLPQAVAVLTGFHVAVVLFSGEEGLGFPAAGGDRGPGWVPGKGFAALCGLMVLGIELPCFWYAVGMGVRLGREVLSGLVPYPEGLVPRAQAYVLVILPLLLVSAVCEGVAIRGVRHGP